MAIAKIDTMKICPKTNALIHQRTHETSVVSGADLEVQVGRLNESASPGEVFVGYMPGTHWRA